MSLFKARDLWSTHCGGDESFDQASIITANVGGNSDKIIVGSHNGYLRVFQPSPGRLDDGSVTDYKPTDLLLETQLANPILQVGVGRLVSGSQNMHICLLHPRSVAVYSLATRTGAAEHGDQSRLVVAYEHQLRRSAYSMVVGAFGGIAGRDFLCVQSLDGALCFFEQETFAFIRFLPLFLLPGPLVYLPITDSFLTVSSTWNAECYRYQVLAEAGGGSNQDATSGRKVSADWSYNLGEAALDVVCIVLPSHSDIVILGERNLYCLRDNGTLRFMKRLEYKPCCLHTYLAEPDGKFMVLIVTDTNTLLVYEETSLRWSAQLVITPVAMNRINLENLDGVLVLLSESGELQCCYLGTEPSLFMAPPLEVTAVDYEESRKELLELQKMINAYSKENSASLANTAADREIRVTVSVDSHMETCTFPHGLGEAEEDSTEPIPMCRIDVELMPHSPLSKVQVSFVVDHPLRASQVSQMISSLCEKSTLSTFIYVCDTGDVPSLDVRVVTSYVTSGRGFPRVLQTVIQLPLKLVMRACPPAKEAEYKITINTNQPAVSLAQIFPEFIGEGSMSGASNAIGFLRHGPTGCVVTALAAKSSQRYRLQCDAVSTLGLLVAQLVSRLKKHFVRSKDFTCSFSSSLPLHEMFIALDTHFSRRREVFKLQYELGQGAAQFRVIQRRLLLKLKDKTPTSITSLEVLLKSTYQLILASSDKVEECQRELELAQCQLACVVRLVLLLLQLSPAATHQHFSYFMAAISANINDAEEQGWEEVTGVGIAYLLRTSLARTAKEQQRSTPLSLGFMKDTTRFKKHIASAIDRMSKNSHAQEMKEKVNGIDKKPLVAISTIPEVVETPHEEEGVVPIGSHYAERKPSAQGQPRGRSAGLLQARRAKTPQDEGISEAEPTRRAMVEPSPLLSAGLERLHTAKDPTAIIESPPEIFPDGDAIDLW